MHLHQNTISKSWEIKNQLRNCQWKDLLIGESLLASIYAINQSLVITKIVTTDLDSISGSAVKEDLNVAHKFSTDNNALKRG